MNHFPTIVIGAGPGGLSCATALARHGQQVLLLERRRQVGPKVCAGGVPATAMGQVIPAALVEKSFPQQTLRTGWQQTVISDSQPIIATVDRGRLGQWMLAQALEAGVIVKSGVRVQAIDHDRITTSAGEFGYRQLVGADGSSSLVRRYLKLTTLRLGSGLHYRLPGDFPTMEWHLDAQRFKSGYAWIFPHRDHASVGIYAERQALPPHLLHARLQQWAAGLQLDLGAGRPEAALINFDFRGWHFGRRFLVGDAAGLASGLTGEGIYPAIVSGEAAAAAILNQPLPPALAAIIRKHRLHSRLQSLFAANKLICQMSMEMLVLGLRSGLLPFHALEMA